MGEEEPGKEDGVSAVEGKLGERVPRSDRRSRFGQWGPRCSLKTLKQVECDEDWHHSGQEGINHCQTFWSGEGGSWAARAWVLDGNSRPRFPGGQTMTGRRRGYSSSPGRQFPCFHFLCAVYFWVWCEHGVSKLETKNLNLPLVPRVSLSQSWEQNLKCFSLSRVMAALSDCVEDVFSSPKSWCLGLYSDVTWSWPS